MSRVCSFNMCDGIAVVTNMVKNLDNIQRDSEGKCFFYGGTDNNIECLHNKTILEDNESRLRKTFKNHPNWSNMRHSHKPVANHLRFLFSKITNTKSIKGILVRFGNYTCKKYYIPECITRNLTIECINNTHTFTSKPDKETFKKTVKLLDLSIAPPTS